MRIVATTDLKQIPPVLRRQAVPVRDVKKTVALFEEFLQTLHQSGGIGLAAPQVGISERFFVTHYEPSEGEELPRLPLRFLINPEIVSRSEESRHWNEGCLSLPGYIGVTHRAKQIKVRGINRYGKPISFKAAGLEACAIQHEIDHLDGVLFIDHASEIKYRDPAAKPGDAVVE